MATHADDLLDDFNSGDEGGNEFNELDNDNLERIPLGGTGLKPIIGDEDNMDEDAEEEEDVAMGEDSLDVSEVEGENGTKTRIEKMKLSGVKDVRSVANLIAKLEPVLEKINKFRSEPEARIIGNIEDHPEYDLLTQSNNLSTQIDGEIIFVHKFIRDHYSVRFPELENLVTNPLEYAKTVAIIGNGPMDADSMKGMQTSTNNQLGLTLKQVIDGPTMLIVTMEATRTKGVEMSPEQLERVTSACKLQISLDKAKITLTEYVQSRMNLFAPNLTTLLGSLTAAQILNAAGGLAGLLKTPACNLAAWGSKKQNGPGKATNTGIRQQGFLYHCPLIMGITTDMKQKAMKKLAAKLALAARADQARSPADGSYGLQLHDQVIENLEKISAPPSSKNARALPVPDDKPARKRGGRRARKAKEATAMTELRKAQNRMAFGKEEKEVGLGTSDGTVGMGMIGASNDGRIRTMQVDNRTRVKLGQKHKGWGGFASSVNNGSASSLRDGPLSGVQLRGNGLRTSGVGTTVGSTSGLQSSLAFTPVQGLELVDPKLREANKRKREAEQDRWFKSGTFTQVGGSGRGIKRGFKVPDTPASKKIDTGEGKMGPPPLPSKK